MGLQFSGTKKNLKTPSFPLQKFEQFIKKNDSNNFSCCLPGPYGSTVQFLRKVIIVFVCAYAGMHACCGKVYTSGTQFREDSEMAFLFLG